jgi:hypothetical protein
LGKSSRVEPSATTENGEEVEDMLESPLFIDNDGPLDESTRHTDKSDGSSLLGRSNSPTRQLIPCQTDSSEIAPEPMDLDRISPSDEDYATLRQSQSESVLEMLPSRYSPRADPASHAKSECTQISLETISLEWSQDERATEEEINPNTAFVLENDNQTLIDPTSQRRSSSETIILSEDSRPPISEELEAFLGGLRRAQVEKEELEKRMVSDRLNEELSLLYNKQAEPGDLVVPDDTHNLSLPTSGNRPAEVMDSGTEHIATQNADLDEQVSEQLIDIKFWSLERGRWNQSDHLRVDRSDPSPVERVARKYLCKGYALYDVNLHSLRPGHCFRAATADGSNAIFLISAHEENQIAAHGGLGIENQLISIASRVAAGTVEK